MKKRVLIGLLLLLALVPMSGAITYAEQEEGPPPPPWHGFMSNAREVTFEGSIVALTFPVATVKTDEGEYYIVRLGPWHYWQEKGFTLKKGERVKIRGFQNDDLVFPKTIETQSGTITLRDDKGYPLWGAMRGPGYRHGRHHGGGRYYCPPCWEPDDR
ncbi:hypothetical protein [Thermodesulforhabdus norvegica]|uniref:DUF5666 domain-containing protein n=1 Tax=Thermodesulforhabdus norvegica TaxID=39841 RepID=A0A1I4SEH3_9BACT|nr:hypothetical protein [Thermodesulforhabdus norvegica]SFM62879.1 hypothetical protein SAMN05660836_00921 [Thermodesulforhabdus norvegica]